MCVCVRLCLRKSPQDLLSTGEETPQSVVKGYHLPHFHWLEKGAFRGSHGEHKLRCLKLLSFFWHVSSLESVKEGFLTIEEALLYMGEHGIRGLDFLAGV